MSVRVPVTSVTFPEDGSLPGAHGVCSVSDAPRGPWGTGRVLTLVLAKCTVCSGKQGESPNLPGPPKSSVAARPCLGTPF